MVDKRPSKTPILELRLDARASDGSIAKIPTYLGQPSPNAHPIAQQMKFAASRGYQFLPEIVDMLNELHEASVRFKVPLIDLCKQNFLEAERSKQAKARLEDEFNKIKDAEKLEGSEFGKK